MGLMKQLLFDLTRYDLEKLPSGAQDTILHELFLALQFAAYSPGDPRKSYLDMHLKKIVQILLANGLDVPQYQ